MRKLIFTLFIAAIFFYFGEMANAAGKNELAPAAKAGSLVKTQYYEIKIPDGWFMPTPLKKQPANGVSSVFTSENGKLAVTINVMQSPQPIKAIAEQTARNMEHNGIKTTAPLQKDGFWHMNIENKVKGEAIFGADGDLRSVISIFGQDRQNANALLNAITSPHATLFPKTIE